MAKDKRKQDEAKAAVGSNKADMESKRRQRAAQSERDSAAARSADGWKPSRKTKDKVEFKHRCEKCLNPSAACRRGAKVCARCNGSAGRSRKRQAVRDGKAPTIIATAVAAAKVAA